MEKIETYIITGFLGAGKTTILNEILKFFPENNGIIENEFGKINIDSSLVDAKYEEMYELTNGCICCSLDGELYSVLNKIALDSKSNIKHLFIETTGIADSGKIASILKKPEVATYFQLKKIICIVDCSQVLNQINEISEIQRQLISSDLIVLNKYSNEDISTIEKTIQKINPFASIVYSKVQLFCKEWLTVENPIRPNFFRTVLVESEQHEINSVLFESSNLLDIEILRDCLQNLLAVYYHQVYRIKGFVVGDNNEVYLVQSTGQNIFITLPKEQLSKSNQLVFIGKKLELKTIERILKPAIFKN